MQLLAQARLAARAKVPLDTVLRRYFAGHTLLGDFVLEEAERCRTGAGELKRRMRAQGTFVERLLGAVAQEYEREVVRRPGTVGERKAQVVRRLLDGESVDATVLGYELDFVHIGLFSTGDEASGAMRTLAADLDCRLLCIEGPGEVFWAWLGAREAPSVEALEHVLATHWPTGSVLAIGEAVGGPAGWRLTHRQAKAALPIARRRRGHIAHYTDVALLASTFKDDLLVTSLRRLYLEPLENERDEGEVARETLRAYFAARLNVSSAASALGVSRQAVKGRLRTIEERIGRSLDACVPEMELMLRIQSLSSDSQPARQAR